MGPGWSSVVAGMWTGQSGRVAGGGSALDCSTILHLMVSYASLVYMVCALSVLCLCCVSVSVPMSLCTVSCLCVYTVCLDVRE